MAMMPFMLKHTCCDKYVCYNEFTLNILNKTFSSLLGPPNKHAMCKGVTPRAQYVTCMCMHVFLATGLRRTGSSACGASGHVCAVAME
jgi:hypothetical protein